MAGGDSTNQDETSTNTTKAALESEFLGNLDQAGDGSFTWKALGLVDLAKHSIGRLGDNSSGETSDKTRAQVDRSLGTIGEGLLVELAVHSFRDSLENDELGHGVRNPIQELVLPMNAICVRARGGGLCLLFQEDRTETRVESANSLILEDFSEPTYKTSSKTGLGNETDTSSLERAESDISEELSESRRGEVDSSSVLGGSLVAKVVD